MDAAATTARTHIGVTHPFEACYRRHWTEVYRQALRFSGGDPAWAEDLAHDVFVRLLEHFDKLEHNRDVGGWLHRVTANLAVSRLRRERSWLGRLQGAWRALQLGQSNSPEVVVVHREEAARALTSVRSLPPLERVVLCLKVIDGHSQREIAEILSLSEGYVSKLVKRATDKARADGWEVSS
jgi:RNA polymerase sigma-70 factor, ECF subfamily